MGTTKIKGVRNKGGYWYARIDGKEVYCGKGADGKKLAKIRRQKYEVVCYENRERSVGLEVKRNELETVGDLVGWYLASPSVKNLKSYNRKQAACRNIETYFDKTPVGRVEGDLQES